MTEELEGDVAEMCNLSQSVLERGKILGREEGNLEKAIAVALNMIKSNFKLEDIAKLTELPLSKVRELKNGQPA